MIALKPILPSLCLAAQLTSAAPAPFFEWSSLTPSPKLAYSPCYGQFQCARLLLPMDWNDTQASNVSIAIIKLPAVVPQDDPNFAGAIFTNPGGPGGSGVDFLLDGGDFLRSTIDIPGKKHYEYISFDPRGVGRSEPNVDCFRGNDIARQATRLEELASGGLSMSPAAFTYARYKAKSQGLRCLRQNTVILPFVGTTSVARDMLAMVDEVAQLRQHQVKGHHQAELPRLQYYGASYGTVIGNVFASMFPERVGRIVLDSVVDCDDYTNGPGWLTNTQDADKMMDIFFETCFKAGPKLCQLCQPGDNSPSAIRERTWSWIMERDEDPIIAASRHGSTGIILRSRDIRVFLFLSLRFGHSFFPRAAGLLASAIQGQPKFLAMTIFEVLGISDLKDKCVINNGSMSTANSADDALEAVMCSDGQDVTPENSTYWKDYMKNQMSISSSFGDFWAEARLRCSGWLVRPKWSYKGPFRTPVASKDPLAPELDRPAAPLLFISNEWDPVTPLRNARAMASQHPGAGVAVAGSMGHGALGPKNPCLEKVVSDYFDRGVVPKEEVYCNSTKDPWRNSLADERRLHELMRMRTRYNFLGA